MAQPLIRPPHPILLQFALEWNDLGRPFNHPITSGKIESNEAISIVRQLNSWRLKTLNRFADDNHSIGINVEAANNFFKPLLSMEWNEINALRFRVVPSANIKSSLREVVIYMPQPIQMTSRKEKQDEMS